MEKLSWTNSDIRKLFKMDSRYKSIQTLYNAEERGEIPVADREPRGKISTRIWDLSQLPKWMNNLDRVSEEMSIQIEEGYLQLGLVQAYIKDNGQLKLTSEQVTYIIQFYRGDCLMSLD